MNRHVNATAGRLSPGPKWGHDDYSLRVENLPQKPPEPGQMELI